MADKEQVRHISVDELMDKVRFEANRRSKIPYNDYLRRQLLKIISRVVMFLCVVGNKYAWIIKKIPILNKLALSVSRKLRQKNWLNYSIPIGRAASTVENQVLQTIQSCFWDQNNFVVNWRQGNKPIAIIIPWFGKDLRGGAEQQAWQVATRLVERGYDIEVLTTCCRSFFEDWATNHFKAEFSTEQGVKIRRFSVDSRNNIEFDKVNARMLGLPASALNPGVNPVSSKDSHIFARENINSFSLLKFLQEHGHDYHAFIFIPYLYGPILNGLPIVADRAFLQPCLHDEVYAYLPEVENIFRLVRGLLFNSEGEAQLALKLYGPGIFRKSFVVGEGVETNIDSVKNLEKIGTLMAENCRYVLCLGRRDPTKNTDLLVRAYASFRKKYPDTNLKLILAGPGNGSFGDYVQGIIDLGLVETYEKEALLANCLALFQPSRNESYSRVIMEAWFHSRPVASHRDCLATAIAVESSKGGWLAGGEAEWAELFAAIDCMDEKELEMYGVNGRFYASENAVWDKVMERYEEVFGLSKEMEKPKPQRKRHLKEIHQLLPNLTYGDAISNHALAIRGYLRNLGYASDIYVRYLDKRVAQEAKIFDSTSINTEAGLLYHHSIGSELTDHAVKHQGPKCLIYHNITPARYFEPYRPEFAKILQRGRDELHQLAKYFSLSVGVSKYNASELSKYGFHNPGVLPIPVDPYKWNISADALLIKQLQDGKTNILFVGRISPNKCQDHLLEAFASYRAMEQNSRLIFVGSGEVDDPYYQHIFKTIYRLDLTSHVMCTGQVNDAQLSAYYRTAHLYWSMSEHEGFCVPIVEAMWFDIPVLAYKSSAIPETLGEAGMMFEDKTDWNKVAALAKRIVHDGDLRDKIIQAQRERRIAFLPNALVENYEEVINLMENEECSKR